MNRIIAGLILTLATVAQTKEVPPLSAYSETVGFSDFAISPDGQHVAFVVGSRNGLQVKIVAAGGGRPTYLDVHNVKLKSLTWLNSSHLLLDHYVVIDEPPTLPHQTVVQGSCYNLNTKKYVTLLSNTPGSAPVMLGPIVFRGDYTGRPVVYIKGFSPGVNFGLYRVDLDTGQGELIEKGTLASSSWVATSQGNILARTALDGDHRVTSYQVYGSAGWKTISADSIGKDLGLAGRGRSDHTLLFGKGDDLVELDVNNDQIGASLIPPGTSSLGLYRTDMTGLLTGVRITADTPKYVFFDENWRVGWDEVLKMFAGARVTLKDAGDNGRQFVVLVEGSKGAGAGSFYYVDLDKGSAELLREARPGLSAYQVAETTAVDFQAADGLTLRGFLTLPPGQTRKNLPLLLLVHGGPSAGAGLDFDTTAQAFASRGFAVFNINYRGSVGVTEALRLAGDGEWGKRMQSDLSDGVSRLAEDGVVDPKRVCIFGAGYGGYAALEGIVSQPNVYRCAVALDPIVDLNAATREPDRLTYGPRWDKIHTIKRYLGATAASTEQMARISPLTQANEITQPILLISTPGSDEAEGTEKMFKAVQKKNNSAEYLSVIDGEKLDFAAQQEHLLAAELRFFLKNNLP